MDRIELEDILREVLAETAPDFYIEEDEQGQLVVVLGLTEDENEELVPFDPDELEEDPDLEPLEDEGLDDEE